MLQEIIITDTERETGALSEEHLQFAIKALDADGCIVLRQAANPAHLSFLRERMVADLETIFADARSGDPSKALPTQFTDGNIQQDPPPFDPYLFKDVLINPFVMEILLHVLGTGFCCTLYSGNTNLPNSKPQPVHPDVGQLWPNLTVAPPPHNFVVNLPLVDVTVHNGATELWLGTHKDTNMYEQLGHIRVPEPLLEARRAVVPPIQPELKLGDIVLRDLRMWHRGVTNHSTEPRPMLALVYNSSWAGGCGKPLTFPKESQSFFQHPHLDMRANYIDEPINYLHRHVAYDVRPDEE